MKKLLYFEIIQKAFFLSWQNKFLWFFGFLILLGSFSSNINQTNSLSENTAQFQKLLSFLGLHPFYLGLFVLGFFLLFLLLTFARILGSASIIKSTNNIVVYRQASLSNIVAETKKYVLRIFAIELLLNLTLFLIAMVLAIPIFYLLAIKAPFAAIITILFAAAIILPIFFVTYFLRRFGNLYLILAEMKIRDCLEAAYSLFEKNLAQSFHLIILSLTFCLLLLLALLLLLISVAIIFAPFLLVAYFFLTQSALLVLASIAALFALSLFIVALCFYFVFLETFWVLIFQELTLEKKPENKEQQAFEIEGEIPTPEVV
jgi:hypothetical protein